MVILLEPATIAVRLKAGSEVRNEQVIAELRRRGVAHVDKREGRKERGATTAKAQP